MSCAIISAAASTLESFRAADAARKQHEFGMTHMDPLLLLRKQANKPGKCESCGSREFQHHRSVLICSYCRSPQ